MDKTQKIWNKDDFFNFTNNPFVNIHMNAEVCRLPESGELPLVWNYDRIYPQTQGFTESLVRRPTRNERPTTFPSAGGS